MELETRDTKIPSQIVDIWQRIVDSISSLLSVPTVMINRLEPPDLEVFRSNISRDNPFPSGTRMPMLGIYCETTARTRQRNQVEGARKDPLWVNSPTAKAGIFSYLGFPVFWPNGEVFGTICAIDTKANKWLSPSDALLQTVKDAVEAHLALVVTMEELDKKNQEKELLLREVHHRIKNNMSAITGMLMLQANSLKDPSAITALKDAQGRVRSMMVLYDKLYRSTDFKAISAKEYLTSLIHEIVRNFPSRSLITVETRIDDCILEARTLSPIGIIINELFTNAMKHAFTDKEKGVMEVSLSIEDNHATLIIQDNGNGIPVSIDIGTFTGFGLQLVNILTEQIEGTIRIEREKGTRFILEFEV